MSYCAIIEFGEDGRPQRQTKFSNAWGGAARIWAAIWKKCGQEGSWLDAFSPDRSGERLWQLRNDPRLSEDEVVVFLATFDDAVVSHKNFSALARALRAFAEAHPAPGQVDHLPGWASAIEASVARAIGFHHTSVSPNPWDGEPPTCPTCGQVREDEDPVPYSLDTGFKHWDPVVQAKVRT